MRDPASIASIDVLVRPGKPSGRGLKSIREAPIKKVAQQLGLNVYERDTFRGWSLPEAGGKPINLIIAVSFGLFIPPRILKSVEYGGINIHPSLLPNFRGPAPLQHALLAGETHTGVTLQTLDPVKFDHGEILAQTPLPGIEIPKGGQCTYQELLERVTPMAAEMLVEGVRKRLFLPGSQLPQFSAELVGTPLKHAPKITPQDRYVDWERMKAAEILRRDRVLGRLWCMIQAPNGHTRRAVFHDLEPVQVDTDLESDTLVVISEEGRQVPRTYFVHGDATIIPIGRNGNAVRVGEITIDGQPKMAAAKALSK